MRLLQNLATTLCHEIGANVTRESNFLLHEPDPPRLTHLEHAAIRGQPFYSSNGRAGRAKIDDLGVIECRNEFRPTGVDGRRQLRNANRTTQMLIVNIEALELADHGSLVTQFSLTELLSTMASSNDSESDGWHKDGGGSY